MGALMGFGMLGIYPSDLNNDEKQRILRDLGNRKWSTLFIELDTDSEKDTFTKYEVIDGSQVSVATSDDKALLDEWKKGHHHLDYDDWNIIFEFDTFLPNSSLGNSYESHTVPDGLERMVSSLEYAIGKIEEQKAAYQADLADGYDEEELKEVIERMDDYLDVFNTALQNNFIVTFSS